MNSYLHLLVFFALASFAHGQFPPFVKLCRRDADINKCVKENILRAQKYVKHGIPKLFVLPTNPYEIAKVAVETPVLYIELKKVIAYGMENFDVKDINIDLENYKFQIDVNIATIEAQALYKFDGKLLGINLNADGTVNGNMTDLRINLSMRGSRLERGGKTYIKFDDRKVKTTFDKCHAFFANLFPNRELTEVTNRIINDNIQEVIYEFGPLLEEVYAVIISDSITKLFEKFSIDELFPL